MVPNQSRTSIHRLPDICLAVKLLLCILCYGTRVHMDPRTRRLRTLNPKVTFSFRWSYPILAPPEEMPWDLLQRALSKALFLGRTDSSFPQISLLSGSFEAPILQLAVSQTRWFILDLNLQPAALAGLAFWIHPKPD